MSADGQSAARVSGWRLAVLLGVAVLALGLLERGARRVLPATPLVATGEAAWIWLRGLPAADKAVAFHAFRDFDLAVTPKTATLLLAADEEYVLLVNGELVGVGHYRDTDGLDVYDVASYLRSGRNRMAVELRSSRFVGGFIANLDLGAQGVVVTGPDWRVVRGYDPNTLLGGAVRGKLAAPHVWGRPPVGRWGIPRAGRNLAVYREVATSSEPRHPRSLKPGRGDEIWRPPAPATGRQEAISSWVTFDWGEEVVGYLGIRLLPKARPRGLVYLSDGLPTPETMRASATVIAVSGSDYWLDARVRRFRYATVIGLDTLVGAEVYELEFDAERLAVSEADETGVFGVRRPRLRSAIENKVWRELEGVPNL